MARFVMKRLKKVFFSIAGNRISPTSPAPMGIGEAATKEPRSAVNVKEEISAIGKGGQGGQR